MAIRKRANGSIVTAGTLPCSSTMRGAGTFERTPLTSAALNFAQSSASTGAARAGSSDAAAARATAVAMTASSRHAAANAVRAPVCSGIACRGYRKEPPGASDVARIGIAVQVRKMRFLVSRLDVHQDDVNDRDDQHRDSGNDDGRGDHHCDAERVDRMTDPGEQALGDEDRIAVA